MAYAEHLSGYVLYLMPVLAICTPVLIMGFVDWLSSIWVKTGTDKAKNQHQEVLMTVMMFLFIGDVLSYSGPQRIKINDQYWGEVQSLPQEFAIDETIVMTNVLDFRQHSYFLPEYHVYGWIIPELSGPFKLMESLGYQ